MAEFVYHESVIFKDLALAKEFAKLLGITSRFADKKYIKDIHENEQGTFAMEVREGYDLLVVPLSAGHDTKEEGLTKTLNDLYYKLEKRKILRKIVSYTAKGLKSIDDLISRRSWEKEGLFKNALGSLETPDVKAYKKAYGYVENAARFGEAFSEDQGLESKLLSIADIMDWGVRGDDQGLIEAALKGFYDACRKYKVWIGGGESAILNERVTSDFNITGAATIAVPKGKIKPGKYVFRFEGREHSYVIAEHRGQLILQRCDGQGTKGEFNMERIPRGRANASDAAAMSEDDLGKMVIDRLLLNAFFAESNSMVLVREFLKGVQELERENRTHAPYVANFDTESDISGYGESHFNPTSVAFGAMNRHDFYNPPVPKAGQSVIFVRSLDPEKWNGRCNGSTQWRRDAVAYHGGDRDYHLTPEGSKTAMAFGNPAIKYFELFQGLYKKGLASLVGHGSGGGWDKKFGKVLAAFGLGGEFVTGYEPFEGHRISKQVNGWGAQKCADKYNFCGDAWVVVRKGKEEETIKYLRENGFEGENIGQLEHMETPKIRFTFRSIGDTAEFVY